MTSPHGDPTAQPLDHVRVAPDPWVPGALLAWQDITGDALDAHCAGLVERELATARALPSARGVQFAAGRQLFRTLIHALAPTQHAWPVVSTPRGAPALPPGLAGSISHKTTRVIAVASADPAYSIGVDLEQRPVATDVTRPDLAARICTDRERAGLPTDDALRRRELTVLHFAVKEAVYKAIDPFVQRYVAFREVELELAAPGETPVRLLLDDPVMRGRVIRAHWHVDGPWIIARAMCSQ